MRTRTEILEKAELLSDPKWPQGESSAKLLREYHSGGRPSGPDSLRAHLEEAVRENWEQVLDGDERASIMGQVKVQTIIWMMGNDDLLQGISRMPQKSSTFIADRLETVCKHYGIMLPEEQSEEE
jgi:hypothetical protein